MIGGGSVLAITLWTRGRRPYLVGSNPPSAGPRAPGSLVVAEWKAMGGRTPGILLGEFVVLPDRLRALLFLTEGASPEVLAAAIASFMGRSSSGLGLRGFRLWDPDIECVRVESPFELVVWQRRIRAAPGHLPGQVDGGVSAEEAGRLELEPVPLERQDGPVLRPRNVVKA